MKIAKLFKSTFFRYSIQVFSGAAVAQVISLLSLPLLTYLYSTADFGVLAIFSATINLISPLLNGKLETALVITDDKEKRGAILFCSLFITALVSLLAYILLLSSTHFSSLFFESVYSSLTEIQYLIPLALLLEGINQIFQIEYLRIKKFKLQSITKITQSSITLLAAIILFYSNIGFYNLILSYLLGLVFSIILSWFFLFKNIKSHTTFHCDFKGIKTILREFKGFPLFEVPRLFINSLVKNIPFFFTDFIFGKSATGILHIAYKIIIAPSELYLNSVSPVFFSMSREKLKEKKLLQFTVKYLSIASLLSIPSATILFISIPYFLPLISLPHEWQNIIETSIYLFPLALISIIISVPSTNFDLLNKLKIHFFHGFGGLIVALSFTLICYYFSLGFHTFLILFFWGNFLYSLSKIPILLFISYRPA